MRDATGMQRSVLFWGSTALLLLWGLGGASIYVAYFLETPTEFAQSAETAANRDAYADYVANIPAWAIAAGISAALSRLLGVVGLFLRRTWALPLYVASLLLFVVALYRAFVLADVASVMSGGHIATEIVFLALSIYAVCLSWWSKSRGILR